MMNNLELGMCIRAEDINDCLRKMKEDVRVKYKMISKSDRCTHAYVVSSGDDTVGVIVYYSTSWWCKSDWELAEYLLDVYKNHRISVNMENLGKDYILANVFPRLVPADQIDTVIESGRIYQEYLDMLVLYYMSIPELTDQHQKASMWITHTNISYYGISQEELYHAALTNLESHYKVASMRSMLDNLLTGTDSDEDASEMPIPMLVATNRDAHHGASVLISKRILEEIRKKFRTQSIIILPSSVHEVIAIADTSEDLSELKMMVTEINRDIVDPDDRLTDSVYVWDGRELQVAA